MDSRIRIHTKMSWIRNTAVNVGTYVDSNDAGEEGHEGALLQLVAEDGRVGATGGTHRQPRSRVSHRDGNARLGTALTIQQNMCSK
jgi:hypothetical protein